MLLIQDQRLSCRWNRELEVGVFGRSWPRRVAGLEDVCIVVAILGLFHLLRTIPKGGVGMIEQPELVELRRGMVA